MVWRSEKGSGELVTLGFLFPSFLESSSLLDRFKNLPNEEKPKRSENSKVQCTLRLLIHVSLGGR